MKLTKREYTESFCMLIAAGPVYALSQLDFLLPLSAGLIILPSYINLMQGKSSNKSYFNMPLRTIISISIILGGLWRMFVPSPPDSISFIPVLLPALQSASIIFSVFIWFRLHTKWRSYYLRFLPWLTVTLSINVPFNMTIWLFFWFFCFLGISFIIARLYFPESPELAKAFKRSRYKGFLIYLYPIFLALIAFVIFFGLNQGIHWGDDIFMHIITDYMGLRHFNFFDFTLRLSGYGRNRYDIRPVLEVDRLQWPALYLVGQVFETYNNGIWQAPLDVPAQPIAQNVSDAEIKVNLTMFEYVGDIIPVPRGVQAIYNKKMSFEIDKNGIVLNKEKKIPRVVMGLSKKLRPVEMTQDLVQKMTAISIPLKKALTSRAEPIVGEEGDPFKISLMLERYFRKNFQYSLNINYHLDDKGLLYLLDNKAPAYCTYFATAMTLILRERGIPARMVGGFLATEIASFDKSKFIARGRDAHAWVEALLPLVDPKTKKQLTGENGIPLGQWIPFDPTPPDLRVNILKSFSRLNLFADWVWCMQKRLKAGILDIETKTLVYLLFGLVFIVVLEEVLKKLYRRFFKKESDKLQLFSRYKGKKANPYWSHYKRYDYFIRQQLKINRRPTETDTEIINKMRDEENIPEEIIQLCEDFISIYHAARFGMKEGEALNKIITLIEMNK